MWILDLVQVPTGRDIVSKILYKTPFTTFQNAMYRKARIFSQIKLSRDSRAGEVDRLEVT